jgi:SAM-dependent methyltransferase
VRRTTWDPAAAAAFFDAYGELEWTRFEDGRTSASSLATHLHYLGRYVGQGDRVLDAGCGPGRFTIELARLGARVVAADLSTEQLELHRRFVGAAGVESAVEGRVTADIVDLAQFADGEFDVTVCYGGALSYVLDEAPRAAAELARVTRPGGHLLVSVMSVVGSTMGAIGGATELLRRHGADAVREVSRSGRLPAAFSGGHLVMQLYRWRELERLLAPHGTVVAAAAAGMFRDGDSDHRALLADLELDFGAEPGAIDAGRHMLAAIEIRAGETRGVGSHRDAPAGRMEAA